MVRLMAFVRDVGSGPSFTFVDLARRKASIDAFERGVQCILRCQIMVDGRQTGWCAQHDEIDFRARPGRSFELASLSGAESVGVTRLLMSISNPSHEIRQAIRAACTWLENAKLTDTRLIVVRDERGPKGWNKIVTVDPQATPLWGRFYDIETNRPIFVDRDGIPRAALSEIGYERRNHYAWYGDWPKDVLEVEFPAWAQLHREP